MIFIVFGLPGSGKSYFASHLAEMKNAQYINFDRLERTCMKNEHIQPLKTSELI